MKLCVYICKPATPIICLSKIVKQCPGFFHLPGLKPFAESVSPTFAFVPSIVEAVAPTRVLAAVGIATVRQLAAALLLSADAVSIGTRFVASEEAFAHLEYKRRLVEAADPAF